MPSLKSQIERAIGHYGSQAKLAEAMGCSQQLVSQLLKEEIGITAETAMKIDAATNGSVSKHDLRPDVFGPVPREASAA